MLSEFIFWGLICILCYSLICIFKRCFEEVLFVSLAFIVFFLFLLGIIGVPLHVAVIILALCVIALGVFEIGKSVIYRTMRENLKLFYTPATLICFCSVVFIYYISYDLLATRNDDFSHWMDCVKTMCMIDDFVDNPVSRSMFKSYPPGMALFQYFHQCIYSTVQRSNIFCEWRAYVGYGIFWISLILPVFRKIRFKSVLRNFVTTTTVLFVPLFFFSHFYNSLQIDPILSALTAVGFYLIWSIEDCSDNFYRIQILSICGCLVLMKDAGLLFSIFIAIAYFAQGLFWTKGNDGLELKTKIRKLLFDLMVLAAVFIPKILWKYDLMKNNAQVKFGNKLEFALFIKSIFGYDDGTYRSIVSRDYIRALFENGIEFGESSVIFPYFYLGIGVIMTLFLIKKVYDKYFKELRNIRTIVFACATTALFLYLLGIGVAYISNFSEYEASGLASMDRYTSIGFMGCSLLIIYLLFDLYKERSDIKSDIFVLCFCFVIISVAPSREIYNVVFRQNVRDSHAFRNVFIPIADKIEKNIENSDSKIWLISQESNGADTLIVHFTNREYIFEGPYSIGVPFFEDDVWTVEFSKDDFANMLNEVDYMAILLPNSYFCEQYGEFFEDPSAIDGSTLFRVNHKLGQLELVE